MNNTGKIKGWELVRDTKFSRVWFKSDGITGGIQNKTKYPFVAIGFEVDGWNARVVHYTQTQELGKSRTKAGALSLAVGYMKSNPTHALILKHGLLRGTYHG